MDPLPEYAELDTLEEVPRSEEQKDTVIFHKSSSSHGVGVVVPYPLPPTYTSSPSGSCAHRPSTHTFTLNSDFSVRLTSHAASDDSTPIFHDGSTISGTVELVVKSGLLSTLDSVTVSLRGHRRQDPLGIWRSAAVCLFMRESQVLWDSTLPRLPKGRVDIPFKLEFPKSCDIWGKPSAPPPSLRVPGFLYSFDYELVCTVKFKLLNLSSDLVIPVRYLPRKEAGAPSPARALAYARRSRIPGPLADPTGWKRYSIELDVRAFDVRDARVTCTFSLPLPLEYPCRYPIPYHLAVTCADDQVLDLLSTHSAFTVVLARKTMTDSFDQDTCDFLGRGRSWVAVEEDSEGIPSTRHLDGEIRLSPQLLQIFSYPPQFSMEYSVDMRINAPGISMPTSSNQTGWLFQASVEITSLPASGSPLPVSYAPALRVGETEQPLHTSPAYPSPEISVGIPGG